MTEEKQMRELDDKEQALINKRLESHRIKIQGLTFAKHQAELMINEGIDANKLMDEIKYKKQLSVIDSQIQEILFTVDVGNKQLREGVQIKTDAEKALPSTITVTIPEEANYYDVVDRLEDMGLIINKEGEQE